MSAGEMVLQSGICCKLQHNNARQAWSYMPSAAQL